MRNTCRRSSFLCGLLLMACQSQGGYQGEPPLPPDEMPPVLGCGNGAVDKGERCDTAIAAGQPGACPSSCLSPPADRCVRVTLAGSACQARCESTPITAPTAGDGCCPAGTSEDLDSDCRPIVVDGSEQLICDGTNHVPVLSTGGGRFALGCVPQGSQNVTPVFKIFDDAGAVLKSHSLLTIDGHYYNEIQTTAFDGRIQALYQYNCADNGSWNVGWGWGCIDFREYGFDGAEVTPSLVFGQRGHNGHPVLDWNGAGFGVGWVSYDVLFSRLIDASRKLVGGDRLANNRIEQDPQHKDDRNGARTRLVWNGSSYGLFSILGGYLYFTNLNSDGSATRTLRQLAPAYAQTFGGNFSVVVNSGVYYVAYFQPKDNKLRLSRYTANGDEVGSTDLLTGEYRFPSLIRIGERFYVFTHDDKKQGQVHVLDAAGKLIKTSSLGRPMVFPQAAYDPVKDSLGVAYLETTDLYAGKVKFQRLRHAP